MFHVEQCDQAEREAFITAVEAGNVPRGTAEKFDRYAALLVEWNAKFNLVAESTLPHLWSRHFLDSAQLVKYLPETPEKPVLVDMGSGAGFPGIVLSILTQAEIHMIESTGKKANFLRTVIDELGLTAQVHQERIEAVKGLKADVITARALALLPELLKHAHRFIKPDSVCLFLKGRNAPEELTEAKKYWTFSDRKYASLTDPSGVVLRLSHLSYKAHKKVAPHVKSAKQ